MNAQQWHATTTTGQANARAIGRRRYNAQRQAQARARLSVVFKLFVREKLSRAEIARRLDVAPSTITRDVQKIVEQAQAQAAHPRAPSQAMRLAMRILARG